MLLKIEYTTGKGAHSSQVASASSSQLPSNHSTTQVLHVNFATASHHSNGILFNVGRKNADVIFDNERSVSRSHCSLRIVSSSATLTKTQKSPKKKKKKGDDEEGEKEQEKDTENYPKPPETDEEIQACGNASDGLVAILDDLGSKFGTKVFMEKEASEGKKDESDRDDSTTDDETDDEGGPSQISKGVGSLPVAAAVGMMPPHLNQIVKTVEKNGSVVLPSLSLSLNKTPPSSVMVQCGNAHFKITRIPLEFCTSRIQGKEKKEMEYLAPRIGAIVTSTFHCNTITHLVTPDQISTAKSISAWALNIPIVTSAFISALASRTDAMDVWPDGKEEEYVSPGELAMEERLQHDPSKRRCITAEYKLLSLQEVEGEVLMRSTGATVVQLYRKDENGKTDVKFWQNSDFWDDLVKQQKKDGLYVVWMDSTKKSIKKGRDFIVKKMKEHDANEDGFKIATVSQTVVATAISKASNLFDSSGRELIPLYKKNKLSSETVAEFDPVTNRADVESAYPMSHQQLTSTSKEPSQTVVMDVEMETVGEDEVPKEGMDRKAENEPEAERDEEGKTLRKKRQTSDPPSSQGAGWMSSQSQTKTKDGKLSQPHSMMESRSQGGHLDNEDGTDGNLVDVRADVENEELDIKDDGRKKLPVTADGWMCAAPRGEERSRYKLTEVTESAETEVLSNLVVRSDEDLRRMRRTQSQISRGGKNFHRKDFKRFKKNSIIAGANMHSLSGIKLVSVLPKESERQRELQAIQMDFDREQLEADSLFAGDEDSKRGGRGIKRYFGRASAKAGTRRH